MIKRFLFISLGLLIIVISGYFGIRSYQSLLIVNESLMKSDAIVVLNGTNIRARLKHAAELYKDGWAPKIIISGHWQLHDDTGIHLGKVYLIQKGVPEEAVLLEDESRSTFENALRVGELLPKHGIKSILLVTSPLHTYRARMLFKALVDKSVRMITVCDADRWNQADWRKNITIKRELYYEMIAVPVSVMDLWTHE